GGGGGGGGGVGAGIMGGGHPVPQQPQENPTITQDKKDLSAARADKEKANTAYTDAAGEDTKEYQKNPEFADAQKAVDKANKDLNAIREKVIEKLKSDA